MKLYVYDSKLHILIHIIPSEAGTQRMQSHREPLCKLLSPQRKESVEKQRSYCLHCTSAGDCGRGPMQGGNVAKQEGLTGGSKLVQDSLTPQPAGHSGVGAR